MKIRLIPALLALCITAIITACYLLCNAETGVTIFAVLAAAITSVSAMALNIEGRLHESAVFRVVCGLLFAATLVLNILFALFGVRLGWIAVANATALVVWMLSLYGAAKKH